jgi:hypothetical protein
VSDYPEGSAVRTWLVGAVKCSIVRQSRGHLCGYARCPQRPVKESGYHGILSFVPVHGGITYAREHDDGTMVYGFDCNHSGDFSEWDPSGKQWTEDEVAEETNRMVAGIMAAAPFEDRYLLAADGSERAAVLDEYHATLGGEFDVSDNFGAMIGVLSGLARP